MGLTDTNPSFPAVRDTLGGETSSSLSLGAASAPIMGRTVSKVVIILGKKGPPIDDGHAAVPPEGARETKDGIVISASPDVCKTPMGSARPPVPYNIYAKLNEDAKTTESVRFRRKLKAYTTASHTTCCHGDAPGSAKGIKSSTVGGICEPKTHSAKVRAEGNWVFRHDDECYMNSKNTTGFVSCSGDNGSYWPRQRSKDPETNAEEQKLIQEALTHPNKEFVQTDKIKTGRLQVAEYQDQRSLVQAVRVYDPSYTTTEKPVQMALMDTDGRYTGTKTDVSSPAFSPKGGSASPTVRMRSPTPQGGNIIALYLWYGNLVRHYYPEKGKKFFPDFTNNETNSQSQTQTDTKIKAASDVKMDAAVKPDTRVGGEEKKTKYPTCEPPKAREFMSLSRYGKANSSSNPWAAYQREKCGETEYNLGKLKRQRRPIADGLKPEPCPQDPWLGCLILEAKYSPAKTKENSLYGYNIADETKDPARKWLDRFEAMNGVDDGGDFAKQTDHYEGITDDYAGDTKIFNDDHNFWKRRRVASAMQVAFYYAACTDPDVPYHDFVYIFNNEFMRKYFETLIPRKPGHLIKIESTLGDGRSWT